MKNNKLNTTFKISRDGFIADINFNEININMVYNNSFKLDDFIELLKNKNIELDNDALIELDTEFKSINESAEVFRIEQLSKADFQYVSAVYQGGSVEFNIKLGAHFFDVYYSPRYGFEFKSIMRKDDFIKCAFIKSKEEIKQVFRYVNIRLHGRENAERAWKAGVV
ncbi:Uncharacterised protein [Anaerobiospirillum thomasii]|uniref:hypothetical protein n=1 Tax=Anaerobiospirillum thomasii TaxID=179995 RepID=UPI000D82DE34|nr:hypothetical protein [Anaerobiospirillum thomasii]SPT71528.1 Uncharacterised protein [Anaerobiospirillum thomasii]